MKNPRILGELKHRGLRQTRVRSGLLAILTDEPTPQTANDLLKRLASRGLRPNKTTVYRDVDILVGAGLIQPIDFGDGTKRYESRLDHHHHLVCLRCKTITDVSLDRDLSDEERRIASHHHFTIQRHALEFFGLCRNCQ